MQHRRVALLRRAGQSFVDLSLALDQRRMHETSVKDARAFGGRTQQPDHQDSLDLVVKWEPGRESGRKKEGLRERICISRSYPRISE